MCCTGVPTGVHGSNCAKFDVASNGVKERKALYEEYVGTQSELSVGVFDGGVNRSWGYAGNVSGFTLRCFAFEGCNVRPVDDEGALGVVGGDGGVADEVVLEGAFEIALRRSTK